jgi:hypothetical protein
MATIGETTRPAFAYDSATDTWIPVGVGPHAHTPAAIGAIASSVVTTKGDLIVGTSSGVVARQGVGADGTYLAADSAQTNGVNWVAPAMTLINTTTFAAVSAKTIDNLFSATYDNYRIIVNITACSVADIDLYAQFRSGGSNVTTNNNTEVMTQYSTGITGVERSNLIVFGQVSTTYPRFVNQMVDVCNPFLSATTTVSVNGGYVTNAGVPYQFRAYGYNFSTTSMTGINLYPSSGTISGTIRIYGMRNS